MSISLYRVIWRVRVMTLHLGVVNGEIGMGDRTWDHFCDVLVMISCPGGCKGLHLYSGDYWSQ